jgi:acyl-coenzyme A synthetase/AMP-(fatty) acid ligase/aryl carrier-like protein
VVPTLLEALVTAVERASELPALPALRWLVVTGEALPPAFCARWLAAYPGIPVVNAYGPTECSDDVTHQELRTAPAASAVRVPIGHPLANTRLYVLDGGGAPVPAAVAGEVYVGGAGVGRGYVNRPGPTADRFVPDAFSGEPGARLYRTGDVGRWLADGTLEYLGRVDFQVKVRGYRIELGEIEAVLGMHAGVQQAVVVGRAGATGDMQLVAYYAVSPSAESQDPSAEVLRAHVAERLPTYMVPAAYVQLDALPLTPNGKVDRKALPAPGALAYATQSYEAPEGPVETAVAEVWAALLKLERVGRHDDFFALGGHSLLAVRAIEHLRQRDIHVQVKTLFAAPTLAAFAAAVGHVSDRPVIVPPNRLLNLSATMMDPSSDTEIYL